MSLDLPVVHGDDGTWGDKLNAALTNLDTRLSTAGVLVPTAVKTGAYTAAANDYVPVDTTSASVTITLPTAPADGTRVGVKHVVKGGSNVVNLTLGGSDVFNKTGGSTTGTLALLNQAAILQYKASSAIWYVISDDLPLSQLDSRYALAGSSLASRQVSSPAYAATITPAVSTSGGDVVLNVGTLTGNVTFANPTGTPVDAQHLTLRLAQDATGSRTYTFGTAYAFGTDITAALLPSAANATFELIFQYNLAAAKWRAVGLVRGF